MGIVGSCNLIERIQEMSFSGRAKLKIRYAYALTQQS